MDIKYETSAGGIIYKKEGEKILWLITQHSQHKGWGFPKGLVGDTVKNEPKADAALREVKEEGGIEAKIVNPEPIEVTYSYQFQSILVKKNVFYYLMEYVSGDPNDHDWEVSEAKFVSEQEAKQTLTFFSDKDAFEQILHYLS
ncbi:NUDIX domain-containing protein [Candidatus Roizmanbacteria bacterium]|nr:NUDIX domain-containing protein [Candidatus Roizmanbacteria bacterium]